MSIFTDIYNTVAKFFRQSDEPVMGEASKAVAANRLKLVLMQDRTNLTPKVLEQMRGEMIDLLSKYLEMDKDLLELNFEQEGDQVALMLSIPVIRAKDEKEIEETLKQEALIKGIKLADDEEEQGESEASENVDTVSENTENDNSEEAQPEESSDENQNSDSEQETQEQQ